MYVRAKLGVCLYILKGNEKSEHDTHITQPYLNRSYTHTRTLVQTLTQTTVTLNAYEGKAM